MDTISSKYSRTYAQWVIICLTFIYNKNAINTYIYIEAYFKYFCFVFIYRFYRNHRFPGVYGCIDCTHVAIFPPNIHNQEHAYINRKGYHSINVQLVRILVV